MAKKVEIPNLLDLKSRTGIKNRNEVHSSHILLWTRDEDNKNSRKRKIYIFVKMRSDGCLGFLGEGSDKKPVDSENEVVNDLYRQLKKEIQYIPSEGEITLEDRVFIRRNTKTGKVLHFFAKEIAFKNFNQLEKNCKNRSLIRIPLRAWVQSIDIPVKKPVKDPVKDSKKHPNFIKRFYKYFRGEDLGGNTRKQLIESMVKLTLIGSDEYFLNYFLQSEEMKSLFHPFFFELKNYTFHDFLSIKKSLKSLYFKSLSKSFKS